MRRQLYIVLFAFLLTGCVSPLKQSWYNFNAYYNTFYNAKQSFSEGVELNKRQRPEIDPAHPIRIHESPTQAGKQEFGRAIEKSASILRDHDRSKFVNRAIALIGRSYFYRQEYFSALEKFQELSRLSSGVELQKAVLWQGRTYLELEQIDEGIRFIEVEFDFIKEWDTAVKAEVYAVLAQLYAANEDWISASEALHRSVAALDNNRLRARAYFLHGQIQERLGNNHQALAAYRLASNINTEYDIEFNSLRKLAELHRTTGDYETALRLYRNLERDDKFIEHHAELRYEQARTQQLMGETETAIRRFNQILQDRFNPPSVLVKAKTYYGLGEIYRDDRNNFQMAAAYFDSASSQRVDMSEIYEDLDARELARSFGEYAALKQEISNIDSLLHLASLETDQLESLLAEYREQQLREGERDSDARRGYGIPGENEIIEAAEATEFGFLNVNDPSRMAQARLQFRAVWGERPLTDNWRRERAISGAARAEREIHEQTRELFTGNPDEEFEDVATIPGIDLSEIPFTEEEKLASKKKREQYMYRLGNLFFLSLNMPDSASVYFEKVIDTSLDSSLTARAFYSVIELELEQDNTTRAQRWAQRLMQEYPDSPLAARIADRLGIARVQHSASGHNSVESRYIRLQQSRPDTGFVHRAGQLMELAEQATDKNRKAILMYDAAENYIRAAKQDDISDDSINSLEINDPELEVLLTFRGEYWDRAREILNRIQDQFPGSRQAEKAIVLLDHIEEDLSDSTAEMDGSGMNTERFPREYYPRDPAGDLPICSEEGIQLNLAGGTARVVEELNLSKTQKEELPDLIFYRFAVEPGGTVESFELLNREVSGEIKQIFNRAVQNLSFDPFEGEHSIRCRVPFPVRS